MPSLVWNASISSSRHLNNLESIKLVNYKEYYDDQGQLRGEHSGKKNLPKIPVQFNWRNDALSSMINFNGESAKKIEEKIKTKTYLLGHSALETMIFEL
jgi:hypothetical protein